MTTAQDVLDRIRFVGDSGYADIFPVFADRELRRYCIDQLEAWTEELKSHTRIDKIVSLEAKGFIVGAMLAERLDLPFTAVAKSGRFHNDQNPMRGLCKDYSGSSKVLEITPEHFNPGEHVMLVDDWFETCGQADISIKLLEECGVNVVALCGLVDGTYHNEFAQELISRFPFYCVVKLEK